MESILKEHIVQYLENCSIITTSQHGFQKGRSCLTNLLSHLNYVTGIYDSGKPIDVIYLDFSKAFDKVPHHRLLVKLKGLGFHDAILDWIKDWLIDRKQRVVLNNGYSKWANVSSGVPQGSVLGPLLFILYVNDLGTDLKSRVSMFADDTKLVSSTGSDKECDCLQDDLNKLIKWVDSWQMMFNIDKCKVMHIGAGNKLSGYTMNDKALESTSCEKDLGVEMSSTLKMKSNVDTVVKKANRILGFINRTMEDHSSKVILPLYRALVRPHLEYCVQVWSPYLKKDIAKIEKVQKRAVNMMRDLTGLRYEEKLKAIGLFTLDQRRLRGDLIETFKILHGYTTANRDCFTLDSSNRSSRGHNYKIMKQFSRTNVRKYFFVNRVVDSWNSLPCSVVNSRSVDAFKRSLDRSLFCC